MRSTLDRPVMGAPLPTAPCFIVRGQTTRRSLAFTAMMKPAGERGARDHRSEVMLSVLVVVFCRNRIAILSFSAGQRQISLIALFHVLKALRLGSG